MQKGPLLVLTGCDPPVAASGFRGSRSMAVMDSNVGDAKVIVRNATDLCVTSDGASSCFELEIELFVFLEAYETDTSLIQLIQFAFGQDAFANHAGPPFGNIDLVSVQPHDLVSSSPSVGIPNASPSGIPSSTPSLNPTRAPGGDPTTAPSVSPSALSSGAPSVSPSYAPSFGPSLAPSQSPTKVPVSDPTEAPTAASASPTTLVSEFPTKVPTKAPASNSPTSLPSAMPSPEPSGLPSVAQSNTPSSAPSITPSNVPSARPSESPSTSPSEAPGRCGPLFGGTQCDCDSDYYHCSASGYCGYGGDFYVEGEPREYDCPSAPVSLITSSAVTTQTSTRTSSTGEVMSAWRAIDGNKNGTDYYACSATNFHEESVWWQVDFGFKAAVEKITIWNIQTDSDRNNWNRIAGSTLELYDSNGSLLSTSDIAMGAAIDPPSETFTFSPPIANVVSAKIVRLGIRNPLHVCEFQAFGHIQY